MAAWQACLPMHFKLCSHAHLDSMHTPACTPSVAPHPSLLISSRDSVTSVLPQHWRAPTVAASAAALAAAPPAAMAAAIVCEAEGGSTHMAGHRPCSRQAAWRSTHGKACWAWTVPCHAMSCCAAAMENMIMPCHATPCCCNAMPHHALPCPASSTSHPPTVRKASLEAPFASFTICTIVGPRPWRMASVTALQVGTQWDQA